MSTPIRCPQYKLNSTSKASGDFNTIPAGTNYGDYLYWTGTQWLTDSNKIHLGADAGRYYQSKYAVALGQASGTQTQATFATAIGYSAGNYYQGQSAIAIGQYAGSNSQQPTAIAIGQYAGSVIQQQNAIAIGTGAGENTQNTESIAIGTNAGSNSQQQVAIAIGFQAGYNTQGTNSIAIGQNAGFGSQGSNSIAIGTNAGISQAANSIILNASGAPLNSSTTGLFIKPVRGAFSSTNVLSYNISTNEIFYNGSSQRYKHDIEPMSQNTETIFQLEPKEFKYNTDKSTDIGFIAEEVAQIDSAFAYVDKDGIPEGIQWNTITTYLVAEMKKMKEDIIMFESEIQELKNTIKPKQ